MSISSLFLWQSLCLSAACRARSRRFSRARLPRASPSSPTFPPHRTRCRVHRVYSDTADSLTTPPGGHAPRLGPIIWRPRIDHEPPRRWLAAARYTFSCDWLRVTTRQTCSEFRFCVVFFFFWLLTAEVKLGLQAEPQRSEPPALLCSSSLSSCGAPRQGAPVRWVPARFRPSRSVFYYCYFYYFYTFLGIKVVRLSVWTNKTRDRFGTDSDPVVFQPASRFIWGHSEPDEPPYARACVFVCGYRIARACVCARDPFPSL